MLLNSFKQSGWMISGKAFRTGRATGDLARSWQAERETVVTTRHEEVCPILQELGFPAVRINPASAEVIELNGLFSSLVKAAAPSD